MNPSNFLFMVSLRLFSEQSGPDGEPVRPGHGDLRELVVTGRAVMWIDRETRFFPDVKPGPFGGRFERIEGPRAATTVSVLNDQGPPGDRGIVGQSVRRENQPSPRSLLPVRLRSAYRRGSPAKPGGPNPRRTSHPPAPGRVREPAAQTVKRDKTPARQLDPSGCSRFQNRQDIFQAIDRFDPQDHDLGRRGHPADPPQRLKRLADRLEHGHEPGT